MSFLNTIATTIKACFIAFVLFFSFTFHAKAEDVKSQSSSEDSQTAKHLLDASGISSGLCIYIATGTNDLSGVLLSLSENSSMLIHVITLDEKVLQKYRQYISNQNIGGRVMAEKLMDNKSLPYYTDLAKLIIIDDFNTIKASISQEEILRVLAPFGKLCTKETGKWVVTPKLKSKDVDEWTHNFHGADGNMVSNDRPMKFPIGLRWQDGVPNNRGGFGECAATRAVVLAGGKCLTVSMEDLSNFIENKSDAYLMARDAFNGLPLWKINLEISYGKVELDWRNVWPLVANDKRVFTTKKNELIVINADTGKIENTIATKYQPRRLLMAENTVVAACWEKMVLNNYKDGFENDAIRAVWWPNDNGTLEAYDSETGKQKWSLDMAVVTIAAGDNNVYALSSVGNPPTKRDLIAIDLATGKEKWRLPHTTFGEEPDTILNFAGPGCVVVSKSMSKSKRGAFVISAADGKVKFTIPNSTARHIVNNELWCNDGRYDLSSGAKVNGSGIGATYAGTNIVGGCIPPIVIGKDFVSAARNGGFSKFNENPAKQAEKFSYLGARGACIQGMIPAYGMFYTAQNNCACMGVQASGFLAIGSVEDAPKKEEFEKPCLIEKGPSFGKASGEVSPEDWPMHRQNIERSGGISENLPDTLKIDFKINLVSPGKGIFQDSWNSRLGTAHLLTAPIIVKDTIYVAGINTGEIFSLNSANGSLNWKGILGSRIDSSPTYYKGMLLVGCHDGWMYALNAKDGSICYRVRIAPRDRKIVSFGIVESIWPVVGSVLVHDGLAYVSAGRTTKTDGGIVLVAFVPETGETKWTKVFNETVPTINDYCSIQDGELVWHWLRFDPKTGADLPSTQKYIGSGGMLDGAWSAGYAKSSGRGFVVGKACSSMMVWNKDILVVPGLAVKKSTVLEPKPKADSPIKHPDQYKKEDILFRVELEPHIEWARVNAMALAGNTVLYAGFIQNGWNKNKYDGSAIWIKSTTDGKSKQKEIKIDAMPSFDSLSISRGKVYFCMQDGSLVCLGQQ